MTGWVSEYVELNKSCVTLLTRKDKQGSSSFMQLSDAVQVLHEINLVRKKQ